MAYWNVDDGAYRDAYEEAINSFSRLSDISVPVSAPEFIATTTAYEQSNARVLVLGQETGGNGNQIGERHPWDVLGTALGSYIRFDIAIGSGLTGSPFWCAYSETCNFFGLSRQGAAWANLSAVQGIAVDGAAFANMPYEQQVALADWQKVLFNEMLLFVRPKRVLAVVGPNYDGLLSSGPIKGVAERLIG